MRVLLVLPPTWDVGAPSLGIAYISAVLKEKGMTVRCLDYNAKCYQEYGDDRDDAWAPRNLWDWSDKTRYEKLRAPTVRPLLREIESEIETFKPDLVGFSVYTSSVHPMYDMIDMIRGKDPSVKIIYGGPSSTDDRIIPDLESGRIDGALVGEGEVTAPMLVEALVEGKKNKAIPGSYILGEEGTVLKGCPLPLMNLKDLPYPDFDDLDFAMYKNGRVPFLMSRGCVAKCNFCSETQYWQKFRIRPAEHTFGELKRNYEKYNMKYFVAVDSLINGSHGILSKLVDMINNEGMDLNWGGYARIDKRLLKDNLLDRMYKAGIRFINFGFESGSQHVLDAMEKNVDLRDAMRVIPATCRSGIKISIGLIVGYPAERWRDYFNTLWSLFKLRKNFDSVATGQTMSLPMNTPVRQNLDKFNIEITGPNWFNWRTKDRMNTWMVRRWRLSFLRRYLTFLRINWI